MKLKERLEMIEEENCSINDTVSRIYYILRHLVYSEPKAKELFVLGKFLLELLQDVKTNAEGVNNVLRGIFSDEI